MKVRILEAGYENYTGTFGLVQFVDGVSKPINEREAAHLGAVVRLHEVNEEDPAVSRQVGPGQHLVDTKGDQAPAIPDPITSNELDQVKPQPTEDERRQKALADAAAAAQETANLYTRAELESLADKGGIKALREIGDPLNVKSNAIPALIDQLLAAKAKKGA